MTRHTLIILLLFASQALAQQLTSNIPFLVFPGGNAAQPYAAQSFTLSVSGGANVPFTYTVSTARGGNWLLAQPAQSTTPAVVQVNVNTQGLAAGTYSGTITFSAAGYASFTESVQLTVFDGAPFTLSTTSISFTYASGSTLPSQTVYFTSATPLAITTAVTASERWLSASPESSSLVTARAILVYTNPIGLQPGTYTGAIHVTAGGATQTITVTLSVASFAISPSTDQLYFSSSGSVPQPQSIVLSAPNSTPFTAAPSANWISVTPTSAVTPATLSITANPGGFGPGTHTGTVQLVAGGQTRVITITLTILGEGGVSFAPPSPLNFFYHTEATFPTMQTLRITSSLPIPFSIVVNDSGRN